MKNWLHAHRAAFADRHYTTKAKPGLKYFFNLYPGVLNRLRNTFGTDFCVGIAGDKDAEHDFWCIPFGRVADLFTEETLTKAGSKKSRRWLCNIAKGQLQLFPGAQDGQRGSALVTDVSDCYSDRGPFGSGYGAPGS